MSTPRTEQFYTELYSKHPELKDIDVKAATEIAGLAPAQRVAVTDNYAKTWASAHAKVLGMDESSARFMAADNMSSLVQHTAFVPKPTEKAMGENLAPAVSATPSKDYKTPLSVQLYATEPGKGQVSTGAVIDKNGVTNVHANAQTGLWKNPVEGGTAQITGHVALNADPKAGELSSVTAGFKATTDAVKVGDTAVVGIGGASTTVDLNNPYKILNDTGVYAGVVAITGKNAVIATVASNLKGTDPVISVSEHYTVVSDEVNKRQVELYAAASYATRSNKLGIDAGVIGRQGVGDNNLYAKVGGGAGDVLGKPDGNVHVDAGLEF